MDDRQPICRRCGLPLIRSGTVRGLEKWVCPNAADAENPCSFVALTTPNDDEPNRCPNCGCQQVLSASEVRQTYDQPHQIRRRRVCRHCGLSFHTREVLEAAT